MRVWTNDTFCLYFGWFLVAIGSILLMSVDLFDNTTEVGFLGIGIVTLVIATQLMAFQRNPGDKE